MRYRTHDETVRIEKNKRRKSRQEGAETCRRIVEPASSRFRESGIDDTALADLMAQAGLTHVGFYKHFESKE